MRPCEGCEGFVPTGVDACPHCGRVPRRASHALGSAALAGSLVTLMACYGMAPCPELVDHDKDGSLVCAKPGYDDYGDRRDCDDADPARAPGFPDPEGDGVDSNCDGVDGISSVVSARRASSNRPLGSGAPSASAWPSGAASASGAPSAESPPPASATASAAAPSAVRGPTAR